ncbi:hypothetical protein [Rhizobium tumorigenes]|uniref:Uncharacterized protein n=1 Tax=Rhizobium tumorigenes TaxID=2041385 RepID=A0AAF1KFK8_9HYPH|nr:hypothetical protein [Rhizobium tumorigenes]WFR95268.1 hypothetical protein PR017_16035 [Rhizobium tumorigenes]
MLFLLRLGSLVCLVMATIAGTIDSIRSVASSAVVITSFADLWKSFSPSTFERLQAAIPAGDDGGKFYMPAVEWSLSQPAFAVLLAVSLLLWMVGYRRVPATGRFLA